MLSDLSIALHSIDAMLKHGDLERASRDAIALYDRTMSRDALQLAIHAGNRTLSLGQFAIAIESFAAIVDRDSHQHEARCHLGIAQLAIGDFASGWRNYDDRPTRRGFIQDMQRYQPRLPLWDGDFAAIANSANSANSVNSTVIHRKPFRLLVMAEQGFGDAIQFARYVPLLRDRGIHVTLGCRPPLAKLLATLPQFSADQILLPGQPPPPLDAFTLLMSLPGIFNTMIETIPQTTPYLQPGRLSTAGRELLMSCGLGSALRVGLVWSGSTTRDRDDERSCGLDAFIPLLNTPNVTFFSLQKDPQPRDRRRLLSLGVIDLDPFLLDFNDTAAFIAELDLVISVDTAVVHLAGALGKPVWVALAAVADWRWLIDRHDSPWYPQAQLFRQPQAGDWRSVVASLRRALVDLVHTNEPDLSLIDIDIDTDTDIDNDHDHECQNLSALKTTDEIHHATHEQALEPNPLTSRSLTRQTELQATIAAFQNQDFETATRLCDRLLQDPSDSQTTQTLTMLRGSIAFHCHELALARHWFQRVIALNPQSISGQLNLGNTYRDLGQLQAALACYAQAEAIAPIGHPTRFDICWERSLALLQFGRWREGFVDYEARLDRRPWPPHMVDRANPPNPPQWDGTLRPDLTLILRMSQGFGDAIQAARYVPWLKRQGIRGLRIVIESRPPLTRLLRTLDGVDAIVNVGEPLPSGDPQHSRQAFLMSLPHLCQTTIDTIPDQVPYLRSPGWSNASTQETVDELLTETQPKTVPHSPKTINTKPYKIGVVWSGSPTHGQDFRRSIPLREFAVLFQVKQTDDQRPVQFYSLQPEIRDRDRNLFDQLCTAGTLINLGTFIQDFGDTAELLEQLDLTIAVDTSVIHLAGALAKPAWLLLSAAPDWRWLRDRDNTPWYFSLRLFRQNHLGNWHSTLDKVRHAIENEKELQTLLRCDDAAIIEF